jgi:hypothetical protein
MDMSHHSSSTCTVRAAKPAMVLLPPHRDVKIVAMSVLVRPEIVPRLARRVVAARASIFSEMSMPAVGDAVAPDISVGGGEPLGVDASPVVNTLCAITGAGHIWE